MHQLLLKRLKIGLTVILVAILVFADELFGNTELLRLGVIVAIVEAILVYLGLNSWRMFARLPFKPRWATDLNGMWTGEIQSQWKPDPAGPKLPAIPVTVEIAQDWTKFSVRLQTQEITSRSSGAAIEYLRETDELRVKYFYETDPKAAHRAENPPQTGCAFLTYSRSAANVLSIRYTNDRGLGGDIVVQRADRSRKRQG